MLDSRLQFEISVVRATGGVGKAKRQLPKRWNQITTRLVEFFNEPRSEKKCVDSSPFLCTSLCFDSGLEPVDFIQRIEELVFGRLGTCNRFNKWEKYLTKLIDGYNERVPELAAKGVIIPEYVPVYILVSTTTQDQSTTEAATTAGATTAATTAKDDTTTINSEMTTNQPGNQP